MTPAARGVAGGRPVPAERAPWRFVVLATLAWLVVVLSAVAFHEFWRDEVRALSVATRTPTLRALFAELRYEGHPSLWFLLLRGAHALVPSPLVLPAVAVAVSTAAVVLFLRAAPLHPAVKLLFVFGVVPLYEYTVMARNYGIGMLLLFGWAAAWPDRRRRPWIVGGCLAAMANTNVPAALVAGVLWAVWGLDLWLRRGRARSQRPTGAEWGGLALAILGVAVAGLTVRPAPDLAVIDPHASSVVTNVVHSLPHLLNPGGFFAHLIGVTRDQVGWEGRLNYLLPYATVIGADLFLLLAGVGLWLRGGTLRFAFPLVAAGLTVLFAAIYRGALRHEALVFLAALAIYWAREPELRRAMAADPGAVPRRAPLGTALVGVALGLVLVLHVVRGAWAVRADIVGERSPMGRVAAWIDRRPELAGSAVLGEPGNYLEGLQYYAPAHPLFFPRQRAFAYWTRWARSTTATLSMRDLLAQARGVQAATGRPVVLLVAFPEVAARDSGAVHSGYRDVFTWTPAEKAAWDSAVVLRARFDGADVENTLLYTLRAAPAAGAPP